MKTRTSGKADFQIAKVTDRADEQKIQRTQAENGEDVRGENDEGLARHGKHRRHGIHGENQIGGFHQQQHQRQRGEGEAGRPAG